MDGWESFGVSSYPKMKLKISPYYIYMESAPHTPPSPPFISLIFNHLAVSLLLLVKRFVRLCPNMRPLMRVIKITQNSRL